MRKRVKRCFGRCFGLSVVVCVSAVLLARAGYQDVGPAIMAVLYMRLGTPESQVHACQILSGIANRNPSNKLWMLHIGAVDAALNAMRQFTEEKQVQVWCSDAASAMSLYNLDIMTAAGRKGAVELTVDFQRRWAMDPQMQRGGNCGCYMDFSAENRLRFQKTGGVKVLMDAVRNHPNNADVVVQSWFGFSSGTQTPNEHAFVEEGGIELGIEVMRAHPKSFRVREEVMQAMRTPMSHAAYRQAAFEKGYLTMLVTTMNDAPLDYHQQSPACAGLTFLVSSNRTMRLAAVQANATLAAFNAVRDYHKMKPLIGWNTEYDTQYTVYDDCLQVLAILATVCEAHGLLVRLGAAGVVRDVVRRGDEKAKQYAHLSVASAGWTSSDALIKKLGNHLLNSLDAPCVESYEEEVLYNIRDLGR